MPNQWKTHLGLLLLCGKRKGMFVWAKLPESALDSEAYIDALLHWYLQRHRPKPGLPH